VIIVAGTLRVDPADRSHYLELVSAATALARSTPECLDFAQSADALEPDRINIFERWESDSALEAFRNSSIRPPTTESGPCMPGASVKS
jgi:quinol monooxygenase YgiN